MKKKEYIPWEIEFVYYNSDSILMDSDSSKEFKPVEPISDGGDYSVIVQ